MTNLIYKDLPNPYNFSQPVANHELFVGRSAELEDIRYYLSQGIQSARPVHLALVGQRASGKTSLLNMIALDARARGFCVASIYLTSKDAESEISFFMKVVHAVFVAACQTERIAPKSGFPFGGKGGLYNKFLNIATTLNTESQNSDFPLSFPLLYATAMRSGNGFAGAVDSIIVDDLNLIQQEVGRPILLIIDECDALKENGAILQLMRGVFQRISGYMLAIAGVSDLFSDNIDAEALIARQFKKIEVRPFSDLQDTRKCIEVPLRTIGLTNARRIFDHDTFSELKRIHAFTGGSPYEIQMLCFFMFKRLQLGRASSMELSVDVLNDVLSELRFGKADDTNRLLTRLSLLDESNLQALGVLTWCSDMACIDDIWKIEYPFHGNSRWVKEDLKKQLKKLCDMEVLMDVSGVIRFHGGDFEKLYTKYYIKQRGVDVSFSFSTHGLEDLFCQTLLNCLIEISGVRAVSYYVNGAVDQEYFDIEYFAGLMKLGRIAEAFKCNSHALAMVFVKMIEAIQDGRSEMVIYSFTVQGLFDNPFCCYAVANQDQYPDVYSEVSKTVSPILHRVRDVKGEAAEKRVSVVLPALDDLFREILDGRNDPFIRAAMDEIGYFIRRMYERDTPPAKIVPFIEDCANNLAQYLDGETANNIGYVFMANGLPERAVMMFDIAIGKMADGVESALAVYNLAIAKMMCGGFANIDELEGVLKRASDILKSFGGDMDTEVLLVIATGGDGLIVTERPSSSLAAAIGDCFRAIEAIYGPG